MDRIPGGAGGSNTAGKETLDPSCGTNRRKEMETENEETMIERQCEPRRTRALPEEKWFDPRQHNVDPNARVIEG